MREFYITFGQVHMHKLGKKVFDKNVIGVIKAEDEKKAREIAFNLFGDKFFTTYSKETWNEEDIKFFPRGFLAVN